MLTTNASGEEEDALQGRSGHTDHLMIIGDGPTEVISVTTVNSL